MFNVFKEGEQIMDSLDEVGVQESGKLGSIRESIDFGKRFFNHLREALISSV